jgi:hypothetical protein
MHKSAKKIRAANCIKTICCGLIANEIELSIGRVYSYRWRWRLLMTTCKLVQLERFKKDVRRTWKMPFFNTNYIRTIYYSWFCVSQLLCKRWLTNGKSVCLHVCQTLDASREDVPHEVGSRRHYIFFRDGITALEAVGQSVCRHFRIYNDLVSSQRVHDSTEDNIVRSVSASGLRSWKETLCRPTC